MKTLVKSPSDPFSFIAAIPFLDCLAKREDLSEIALLIDEDLFFLSEFLSQKIFTYSLPKTQKNILGVHKYSVNQHHIFNTETYFDLESSLSSSYLGYCFKARHRIGFKNGWHSFFYHQKQELASLPLDENYLSLYQSYFKDESVENVIKGEGLTPRSNLLFLNQVPENYILLLLDLSNEEERALWLKRLNQFEGQSFIIAELSGLIQLDRFYEGLESRNQYVFEKSPEMSRVVTLAKRTQGVITNLDWMAWIMTLYAPKVIYLHQKALTELKCYHQAPLALESSPEDQSSELDKIYDYLKL